MEAKRLASCLGYAWRIANQFGDPCVVGHLFYALQALQHRQSPAVPVVNNCKATPISLFDALISEPNRWSQQNSKVRTVSTTKTANAVVQTEPEVQVQPLAEDIGQIVQMQVEMQIKPLLQLLTDTQAAMQKREETITSLRQPWWIRVRPVNLWDCFVRIRIRPNLHYRMSKPSVADVKPANLNLKQQFGKSIQSEAFLPFQLTAGWFVQPFPCSLHLASHMLLLDASGVRLSFLVVLPFLPQNFDLGHKLAFSTAGPSGWRWREREIYTCWIFTDFPNPDHAKKISMHRILKFRGLFSSNDAGLCRFLQHFVERHMNGNTISKKMIHNVIVFISYTVYRTNECTNTCRHRKLFVHVMSWI